MAKETLKKNSLLLYFEIFKEKFFKIVVISILYSSAVTILLIACMGIAALLNEVLHMSEYISPLIIFLPLLALGPFTASIIRLNRDFVRREPGFFVQDLWRGIKDNWKQSLIIAIFQYIVIFGLYVAVPFYYSAMNSTEGFEHILFTIGLGVAIFVGIIFLFMSYYLYMMCVTLKLKIKELFKNALIFSFLCLLKNFLLSIILAIFIAFFYEFLIYTIAWKNALVWGILIMLIMMIFFGFIFYTVAFFTFPMVKKYVLDPYYEEHPLESAKGIEQMNASEINMNGAKEEELPEYVYMNGRMVHRSALMQENVFEDTPDSPDVPNTDIEKIKEKYKKK